MLWDTATLIALPVALLALTVSGAIIVSGLNRRHDLQLCVNSVRAPDRFALGRIPLDSRLIDVASEAEAILRQFAGLAAARHVTLEMAVQPELSGTGGPASAARDAVRIGRQRRRSRAMRARVAWGGAFGAARSDLCSGRWPRQRSALPRKRIAFRRTAGGIAWRRTGYRPTAWRRDHSHVEPSDG